MQSIQVPYLIKLGKALVQKEQAKRILSTKDSLGKFCITYLSHHFSLEFCDFHLELFRDLSKEEPNKRSVRIAPRGHGKTTIIALAYPLWTLAHKKKESILLISQTQTLANDKLRDLTNELENNEMLQQDYPHLLPKKDRKRQFVKYTDSQVVYSNNSQIIAKGLGSTVSGLKPRPDIIILDDIEDREKLNNPEYRKKSKRWFDQVVRYLGGAGKTLDILAIDTLKHYDSLIQYLMDKPGWEGKKYSGVVDDEKRLVMWPAQYAYHVDDLTEYEIDNYKLKGSKGFETIRQPYHGKYYENEKDTDPVIVGLAEEDKDSFVREILAQPIESHNMPLRTELWEFFDYSDGLLSEFETRIGALDLALGESIDSDNQAIAILANLGKNYYLLDGSLTRYDLVVKSTLNDEEEQNAVSLVKLAINFIVLYQLQAFIVETNGQQGLFMSTFYDQVKNYESESGKALGCKIIQRKSTGNKEERIRGHLGLSMQAGNVWIRRDWRQQYKKFMEQWQFFPKGAHDDAPDVTNMALMAIQRMKAQRIKRDT